MVMLALTHEPEALVVQELCSDRSYAQAGVTLRRSNVCESYEDQKRFEGYYEPISKAIALGSKEGQA